MRSIIPVAIVLLAQLTCSACSGTSIHKVLIQSDPQGATIFVNGEEKGPTNGTVTITFTGDPEERVFIQLVLSGREPVYDTWKKDEIPTEGKKLYILKRD